LRRHGKHGQFPIGILEERQHVDRHRSDAIYLDIERSIVSKNTLSFAIILLVDENTLGRCDAATTRETIVQRDLGDFGRRADVVARRLFNKHKTTHRTDDTTTNGSYVRLLRP
jgi:hypothetical protein